MNRPSWLARLLSPMGKRLMAAAIGTLVLVEVGCLIVAYLSPAPPPAKAGEFTWQAMLRANNKQCGATIIATDWILTAAHCIDHANALRWHVETPASLAAMRLRNGRRMKLNTARNPPMGPATSACERPIIHKDYVYDENAPAPHDIALIHVPITVDGTVVTKATLARMHDDNLTATTYFGRWWCPAFYLRANAKLHLERFCGFELHGLPVELNAHSWDESLFVIAGPGSSDLKLNDSGSGLTTATTAPSIVIGVANFGYFAGSDHYARVSAHADWIDEVLSEHTQWEGNHSPDHGADCRQNWTPLVSSSSPPQT
jgi:hypothetical protein